MTKKSRRARAKSRFQQPVGNLPAQQSRPSVSVPGTRVERQSMAAAIAAPVNYDYVRSDLVRIGIIAGVMILIIIVLALIPGLNL